MGKKSRERMTGLSFEERRKKAVKEQERVRKEMEEEMKQRAKNMLRMMKTLGARPVGH